MIVVISRSLPDTLVFGFGSEGKWVSIQANRSLFDEARILSLRFRPNSGNGFPYYVKSDEGDGVVFAEVTEFLLALSRCDILVDELYHGEDAITLNYRNNILVDGDARFAMLRGIKNAAYKKCR